MSVLLFALLAVVCGQATLGEWLLDFSGLGAPVEQKEFDDGEIINENRDVLCNLTADASCEISHPELGINHKLFFDWNKNEISAVPLDKLEDDSEEVHKTLLFRCHFANRSNMLTSEGNFSRIAPFPSGTYSLAITGPNSFIFTLFSGSSNLILVTGARRVSPVELTFWQKYSMPLMFLGLFVINAFKPKPPMMPQQPGAPKARTQPTTAEKQD